jgi:CheY-like chemotaxis protein
MVTLAGWQVDEAQARLHPGLRPGTYARLAVADTGHGMDERTRARVFEPFFTTKGPGEGTGLGLSVVHGIMEDHDGAIVLDSRPGEGTAFELYFPQYTGLAGVTLVPDASIPRGAGEAVLLVDDEGPLCEAMRTTLQKLGYRVTACTDPVEAVARFRAAPQGFDLLVTDHTMPRMTGLDVIHDVHRVRPELPVLLVSGLSGTWTPDKLRGFSIRELVAKPIDFAGLAQAVHRALARPRQPGA